MQLLGEVLPYLVVQLLDEVLPGEAARLQADEDVARLRYGHELLERGLGRTGGALHRQQLLQVVDGHLLLLLLLLQLLLLLLLAAAVLLLLLHLEQLHQVVLGDGVLLPGGTRLPGLQRSRPHQLWRTARRRLT